MPSGDQLKPRGLESPAATNETPATVGEAPATGVAASCAEAGARTDNPAAKAFSGPGHGLADYTYGAMMGNEYLGFMLIFVALMSVLIVVRHTRTEEETGRAELIRSGPVGRYAQLTAALPKMASRRLA